MCDILAYLITLAFETVEPLWRDRVVRLNAMHDTGLEIRGAHCASLRSPLRGQYTQDSANAVMARLKAPVPDTTASEQYDLIRELLVDDRLHGLCQLPKKYAGR